MEAIGIPRPRLVLARPTLRLSSDDRLVAQIRAGNRGAFETLYDRHHAGLLSFCRHMLGSREEAEDALQQTFAAAYQALVSDEREIALKAWLYTIARNRCLSVLRVRREEVGLDDAGVAAVATAGLAAEVEQREDLRAMLNDLQTLPDEQRAALILAELGAHSHEEIAVILGVPSAKIKALDVKMIRDAAYKAKSIGQMLTPAAAERIKSAVDMARETARKIVKAGDNAAIEIDRATVRKIRDSRTAFLDLDEAPAKVAKPKAKGRAVDFDPAKKAPVAKPKARKQAELEL